MEIAAGKFKAQCLRLMEQVQRSREEIVITKHGKPVAKLVPFEASSTSSLMGYLKGTVQVVGDITLPLDEPWEVDE